MKHCAIEIFSKSHLLMISPSFYYTFYLLKKYQQNDREKDMPLFLPSWFVWHEPIQGLRLYYRKLKFSSLICNFNQHKPNRKVKQSKP